MGDRLVKNPDGPSARGQQADRHVHAGRLAGAIASKEPQEALFEGTMKEFPTAKIVDRCLSMTPSPRCASPDPLAQRKAESLATDAGTRSGSLSAADRKQAEGCGA